MANTADYYVKQIIGDQAVKIALLTARLEVLIDLLTKHEIPIPPEPGGPPA